MDNLLGLVFDDVTVPVNQSGGTGSIGMDQPLPAQADYSWVAPVIVFGVAFIVLVVVLLFRWEARRVYRQEKDKEASHPSEGK